MRQEINFNLVSYKEPRSMVGSDNPFFGKSHSKETKIKLRDANLGEKCGNAKLTEKDVGFIKMHPDLKTLFIARKFGISSGTVRSIRRGDTWSHVKIKEVKNG